MPKKTNDIPRCEVCDCEVFFNLNIWEELGMCGACATGEARLNHEEEGD